MDVLKYRGSVERLIGAMYDSNLATNKLVVLIWDFTYFWKDHTQDINA